jgi:hypothetical protein
MQLFVKTEKPFVEEIVKSADKKNHITVGIRVYKDSERSELLTDIQDTAHAIKIERWQKQIFALQNDVELTDDEIDLKVKELEDKIRNAVNEQKMKYDEFYRTHVLYIKNASITGTKEDGSTIDINIPDTREAKPVESLWESGEECLAALLNVFLESSSYKDSLQKAVFSVVFQTNFEEAKGKNSK